MTDDSSRECGGSVNQSSSMSNPDPSRAALADEQRHEAGTILAIGGAGNGMGWGCNDIEVRESTGGLGWAWRKITNEERQRLIDALNVRDPLPPTLNSGADREAIARIIWMQFCPGMAASDEDKKRYLECADAILAETALPRAVEGGAAETWAYIERLLHDECGLILDFGIESQRANCINAIQNGLPDQALMAAAIKFLNTGEGLHKIRVNGKMMDRKQVAAALSHPNTGDGK